MCAENHKFCVDIQLQKLIWIFVLIAALQVTCLASQKEVNVEIREVTCSLLGMTIKVNVEKGFNGSIYAEKNYFNPVCRCVFPASRTNVSFFLPENNCGTDVKQLDGDIYFSNAIVIQKNRMVETAFDAVHNVSCKFGLSSTESPLESETIHLDVYESNGMTSWMEFDQGSNISSSEATPTLYVGDSFFLALHHENVSHGRDIRVTKCWAHDQPTIDGSVSVIQVFNMYDCEPSEFVSDIGFDQEIINSQVVSFTRMKAFKFPSVLHLHITCSVEVCSEECNDHCYKLGFNTLMMKHRHKRSINDNRILSMAGFDDHGSRSVAGIDNQGRSVLRFNQGRSVLGSDKQSRALAERIRLMKATIKALGKTILGSQAPRLPINESRFSRRARLDDTESVTEITTEEPNDSVTTISLEVTDLDSSETGLNYTTSQNVNFEDDYEFNLTESVIVLPQRRHASNMELKLPVYCVSRLRFALVTTMLCILAFLLLLVSIALAIALRHEKRKRRIDSFLLYNFR